MRPLRRVEELQSTDAARRRVHLGQHCILKFGMEIKKERPTSSSLQATSCNPFKTSLLTPPPPAALDGGGPAAFRPVNVVSGCCPVVGLAGKGYREGRGMLWSRLKLEVRRTRAWLWYMYHERDIYKVCRWYTRQK